MAESVLDAEQVSVSFVAVTLTKEVSTALVVDEIVRPVGGPVAVAAHATERLDINRFI